MRMVVPGGGHESQVLRHHRLTAGDLGGGRWDIGGEPGQQRKWGRRTNLHRARIAINHVHPRFAQYRHGRRVEVMQAGRQLAPEAGASGRDRRSRGVVLVAIDVDGGRLCADGSSPCQEPLVACLRAVGVGHLRGLGEDEASDASQAACARGIPNGTPPTSLGVFTTDAIGRLFTGHQDVFLQLVGVVVVLAGP